MPMLGLRPAVLAVALLAASSAFAQDRVTVTGCPEPGVNALCLMLKGDDGQLYNISGANPRPTPDGRAVQVTGAKGNLFSICMQGTILTDIKWTYLNRKCTERPTR